MQRTQFDDRACSVAQTVDVIGEWWTPLILRDIFYGVRRFDALRKNLGISRKVLTQRLNRLVEAQILQRKVYQEHPPRHEYCLTERGKELFPIIVTLMAWGDKWLAEEPLVQLVDRETERPLRPVLIDANSGQEIRYETVRAELASPTHAETWAQLQAAIADCKE